MGNFDKMENAKKETIQSQSLREHFHFFSLERQTCHDGSYNPDKREALLRDLLSKRHGILSCLRVAQKVHSDSNSTTADERTAESHLKLEAVQDLGSSLCHSAAWLCILIETLMMVLLETEMSACVLILESLKFWHQLSLMGTMSRRIFYPELHLREGGIRRTSLRRASRLKIMLRYRSLGVANLQAALLRLRRLSNEIILGKSWTVDDQVPSKAFWKEFEDNSRKALGIAQEVLKVHKVKHLSVGSQISNPFSIFRQRAESIAAGDEPESPKTHAGEQGAPMASPSPVRSKKHGIEKQEKTDPDFGNLSILSGVKVKKMVRIEDKSISQPTFAIEPFVANLVSVSSEVEVHCLGAAEAVKGDMGTALKPSRPRRLWPWYSLSGVTLLLIGLYGFKRRDKVKELVAYLSQNALDFYHEHVERPAREIIDEIIFNRRTRITDVDALTDSHDSLRRMLAEFMKDTMKTLPPDEIKRRSEALDMSVVSRKFEDEVPNAVWNIAYGEVARIMLIQVAFIKKELLVAMSAIEDLMDANNFNFRVMATVPAVLLIAGAVYAMRQARSFLLGHHTSEETYASLRTMLLDLERALTRFSSNERCSAHEVGLMLVLLWRFRCLVRSLPTYRLRRFDAVALHADLDEVAMSGLGWREKLKTVERIASSYRFLGCRPAHGDSTFAAAFIK